MNQTDAGYLIKNKPGKTYFLCWFVIENSSPEATGCDISHALTAFQHDLGSCDFYAKSAPVVP